MPKLTFEIMIINNSTQRDTLNLSLAEIKKWFIDSMIVFSDPNQEENLKFRSEKGEISFSFEMKEYNSNIENISSFILTFKSLTNVYKPKISLYDDFVQELQKIISINNCKSYFLNRELSKFYSRELYTIFNDFEVGLRRFMHLIFFKTFGPKWGENIIPKEFKNKIKHNLKSGNSDHIIEEFELSTIETLLFKPIFIEKTDIQNEEKFIKPLQNIGSYDKPEYVIPLDYVLDSTSSYTVFSLWERYFSEYVGHKFIGEKFKENFKKIRQIRNKIAHNKKVTNENFIFATTFLKEFQNEIRQISNSILNPKIRDTDITYYSSLFKINKQLQEAIRESLLPTMIIKEISESLKDITNPITEFNKKIENLNLPAEMMVENSIRNMNGSYMNFIKKQEDITRPYKKIDENSDQISDEKDKEISDNGPFDPQNLE